MANISKKMYFFEDWLQQTKGMPMSTDDLHKPNLTIHKCLGVSTTGTSEWPSQMAIHNHHSFIATLKIITSPHMFEFSKSDSMLVYGSFVHLENLLMFLSGVFFGCKITLLPTFDYSKITKSFSNHKISVIMLPSNCIAKLAFDDTVSLKSITKIITFGGKLTTDVCTSFFKRFSTVKSLRNCYLMAESPCPISLKVRNAYDFDSVGYLLPNTRVKVTNVNGIVLEQHRLGYIAVERHKHMFAIGHLSHKRFYLSTYLIYII